MTWIVENEGTLRLSIFLGCLIIFGVLERRFKFYQFAAKTSQRWITNVGLTIINGFVLRLVFSSAAVGVAHWAYLNEMGLFNLLDISDHLFVIILCVLLFDLIIYWQHRLFHRIPILWRLHRVHHSDPGFDVTTGFRFHPIEILLSMLIKCFCILMIGPSVTAILLFEIILSSMALFNHGNYSLPLLWEKIVRKFLVTPDMHRIHHSKVNVETDSNFGFNLSLWDRIFGSYTKQAKSGNRGIDIGLEEWVDPAQNSTLLGVILMPFRKT
ncbi:MAG: sterol desaturase family protein [Pseudobacteriovorax sp.]|nr:sterol desaturase family protein [Pseudobacteriovorax sp.]